ncbi:MULTISPECIES: transglycosylase domain-containing protein [unclassified Adlercreutzia]|uniref:transglycosylase domain-containing protein n=1 Tax=unclassified Adlercreutzia TaxID=2636013 RepID=UPI0013EA601B|nr:MULTISPECIES: PBP1A family penicillin-binding protein [unclassified Adlercreutzia]
MSSRAVKGRYNIKKKNGKVIALSILAVFAAIIISFAFGVSALANSWLEDLPDYTDSDAFNTSATSVVYASDGTTVLAEFQLENREPVEMDAISDYVKQGTVATEDERFYNHNGFDAMGTGRALVNNLTGGALEGGSTITQQLVRNTILSEEMTDISFKRKLREVYLALKMEEIYNKDDILLMYLNTINYGSGAYGIQAASERYFSKNASDLTLAEAATLVGIPQSPTYNNPINSPSNCLARRNLVLDRMTSNGYITPEEAEAAKAEELVLNPTEPSMTGIKAYPYFTSYVRNQLLNQSGKYAFSTADVFSGGLEIITTLDVNAQAAAEKAAAEKEKQAGEGFEVALAAIEPDNGYIRAMVGGNSESYEAQQVNMATGEGGSGRQPGSSFKTFTLVAALEEGINPETIIDAGESYKVEGTDQLVHNYDNADYGIRPIDSAFAVSSNTAFMRLIMSAGVDNVIDVAHRLGIKSDIQEVAGITLGISSVNPLEMANAYATIANGGTHYDPECVLTIKDRKGNVIVDNSSPEGERVIDEEIAVAALDVMEGVISNGTGKQARLSTKQPVAGKTGTTDDNKDSWFVGMTPQMAVAIWLGDRAPTYEEARPVKTTAASAFASFMNSILDGQEIRQWPVADDPDYQKNYIDEKNHIGKGSWVRYEEEKKEEEEAAAAAAAAAEAIPDTSTGRNPFDDSSDSSGSSGNSGGSGGSGTSTKPPSGGSSNPGSGAAPTRHDGV